MYHTSSLTPQALTVLKHMAKAGSITQREAIVDHSVQSLTKRISEITYWGISVNKEARKHPITGQRYMRYSLARPDLVAL
jgi:predicted RecB family endonuclease